MMPTIWNQFDLSNKGPIAVLGGGGLLGGICCETIKELGGQPISIDVKEGADEVFCDVVNDRFLLNEIAYSWDFYGVINCVVGNQRPVAHPTEGYADDIRIGLIAAGDIMQAFYHSLKKTKGVFLNIGSDLSLRAPNTQRYGTKYKPVGYSVVKHGIVGLTRYYAALWGKEGIRVNCLCPGSIDQGQAVPDCPLNRLAQPHEMKGAIAWLMSEASSYVTGAVICVDGGSTI